MKIKFLLTICSIICVTLTVLLIGYAQKTADILYHNSYTIVSIDRCVGEDQYEAYCTVTYKNSYGKTYRGKVSDLVHIGEVVYKKCFIEYEGADKCYTTLDTTLYSRYSLTHNEAIEQHRERLEEK